MASSSRIDELQKKFDENPRRYFAPLANEYRKAGDPAQAIAICQEFLPQQPGHMSGHIVYGQALYDAQRYEEARAVFDTALSLDPENLIALRTLGDIARNLGDPAAARVWYQRVLDADPRNGEISAAIAALANVPQAPAAAAQASNEPVAPAAAAPTDAPTARGTPTASYPTAGVAEPAAEPTPAPSDESLEGGFLLGATPFDAGDSAEASETEPQPLPLHDLILEEAAEPAPDVPETVSVPAPEFAEPASLNADVPEAVAEPAPSAAAVPPIGELPDIGELTIEPESPMVPTGDTPAGSVPPMGIELDRVDEGAFMPTAPADSDAESGPPRDPFATETMAELYLSQGHADDALRVYRQLLTERGSDARIEAKIASIEAMTALTPAIPMEAVPEEPDAAPAEEAMNLDFEPPSSEPALARQPEPTADVLESEPEAEATAEPAFDDDLFDEAQAGFEPFAGAAAQNVPDLDASAFSFESRAEATPAGAAHVPEPEPASAEAGPSIREFLLAFARHVPGANGSGGITESIAAEAAGMPAPDTSSVALVEEVEVVEYQHHASVAFEGASSGPNAVFAEAPEPLPVEPAVRGGSIDALFGGGRVSTPEETAAAALAEAYGVTVPEPEAPPITGAPARRASEELSLDNVFREQAPPSETPPAGFSFDQFFAGGTPALGTTPVRDTPAEATPPESADADIEQFNSWLEGLKKR